MGSAELEGIVTDMVKLRKLTKELVSNFPLAFRHPTAEPVLQVNGLVETVSVFGRFSPYQNRPKLDRIGQNRAETCQNVPKMDRK